MLLFRGKDPVPRERILIARRIGGDHGQEDTDQDLKSQPGIARKEWLHRNKFIITPAYIKGNAQYKKRLPEIRGEKLFMEGKAVERYKRKNIE